MVGMSATTPWYDTVLHPDGDVTVRAPVLWVVEARSTVKVPLAGEGAVVDAAAVDPRCPLGPAGPSEVGAEQAPMNTAARSVAVTLIRGLILGSTLLVPSRFPQSSSPARRQERAGFY